MKKAIILSLCIMAIAMIACQDDHHPDVESQIENYVRENFFKPSFISSNNENIGKARSVKSLNNAIASDLEIEFRNKIMAYYEENLKFAQQIKNKVGLPVWDYSVYNTYDINKLVFIPCALENSFTPKG